MLPPSQPHGEDSFEQDEEADAELSSWSTEDDSSNACLDADLKTNASGLAVIALQRHSLSWQMSQADTRVAQQCSICLEEFEEGDDACRLPCFHIYHKDCIDSWVKHSESTKCPMCDHSIIESTVAATDNDDDHVH